MLETMPDRDVSWVHEEFVPGNRVKDSYIFYPMCGRKDWVWNICDCLYAKWA